jgi:anti-sigma factor RsiW
MMTNGKLDEWALHAYVDNEITGEQKAEIEALLANDPEAQRTVEAWRQQREALKRAFDGALDEPLPASLTATLNHGGGMALNPFLAMAAALALLLLGGFGGWFVGRDSGDRIAENIAREALVAHEVYAVEVRHPVEVAGADKDHLQAWLSKRLGQAFSVPDLDGEGYTLLGGRLLAAGDRPAAQLMYEDSRHNRITIFLTSQDKDRETALHVEEKGPLIACYWLDKKLAFAVAGEMAREPMMKLAHVIYEKFEG